MKESSQLNIASAVICDELPSVYKLLEGGESTHTP